MRAKEAARALRVALKARLHRPAAQLAHDDVLQAVEALRDRGKGPMTARLVAYGKACFRWAGKQKNKPQYVAGNPFLDIDVPASGDRERVLTEAEILEIWAAAGELGYPFGAWARFAMLTLQRGRQECAGARWAEISADMTAWEIPGSRMKNGKAHTVHLSEQARDLLQTLPRFSDSGLLFTSGSDKPISGMGKAKKVLDAIVMLKRAERADANGTKPAALEPWRFHDFRRTGATRLAEWEFDTVAIDRLLSHRPTKLVGLPPHISEPRFSACGSECLMFGARTSPASIPPRTCCRSRLGPEGLICSP